MRFMATQAPDRFQPIAAAFGLRFDPANATAVALECGDRMTRFIAQFELPQRLRDVQVPPEEIRDVAKVVYDILEGAQASEHPSSAEHLASLLTAAY
jgi:alcohol dehydrogenase class IV